MRKNKMKLNKVLAASALATAWGTSASLNPNDCITSCSFLRGE